MQRPERDAERGAPYEVRIVEDRWAAFRHIIEAVAIVCAGMWAFYTFIYQEKIKPASEPAALNVSISVHSLRHDPVRDILGLELVFRNTGKTEIDIAADGYNVWGENYANHPRIRTNERIDRRQPAIRRKRDREQREEREDGNRHERQQRHRAAGLGRISSLNPPNRKP